MAEHKPAPCKDCPKRFPTCHSDCGDYILWRKAYDEIAKKIQKQRSIESDLYAVTAKRH